MTAKYLLSRITATFLLVTAFLQPCCISASAPGEIRWNDEARDTSFITNLLVSLDRRQPLSSNIVTIAKAFEGRPYGSGTLEHSPELLTINTDTLDCTTLVDYVTALAITINEGRTSWRDFVYNLRNIRYRGGNVDGYPSRLHYVSEWIVDNSHRGNLVEVTTRVAPSTDYVVKTLDYMSSHRDKYPALKDQDTYDRVKNYELGYRSHRYPYIKTLNVDRTALRDGDIIALTTKTPGLDVTHMGIVMTGDDGNPHLFHASSKEGKVILDPLPLSQYLRRSRTANGIRVIRIE